MKIVDYLRDTKAEMRHVTWPSRKQAIAYTIAVIVISLFMAIVLGLADTLFAYVLKLITLR